MKKTFCLTLSLLLCLALAAQPALKLRTFSMADGLPSNSVTSYATASNGMIWIATWNGLCNYDGYRFNSFIAPMGAGQVLTSNRLRFMVPDDNGDVWMTPFDHHLYLLSSKESRYIDCREMLEGIGLKNFEVSFMHRLANGAIWIFGKNGMNIRMKDGKMEVVATSEQLPDVCRQVVLTHDGNEWLNGEKTLRRYGSNSSIRTRAIDVFHTKSGPIVVGDKLGRYNISKEEFTEITMPAGIKHIFSTVQTGDGTIILATDDGVYTYANRFRKISELQLQNLVTDSKNRVWSLTDNGTAVLIQRQPAAPTGYVTKSLSCEMQDGWPRLSSDRDIVHEDIDGNVWLLLSGKTFCHYDEATGTLIPMDLRKAGLKTFPQMSLNKIAADSHKNLWFNCSNITYQLTFANYNFRYVPIRQGEETRAVAIDHHGRFLIGTRQGFLAVLGSDGNIQGYLGAGGVVSPTPAHFTTAGIYAIHEDASHRLWIGTRGDGLYLLQEKTERAYSVEHFTKQNSNICGDDFFDINEDSKGRLWFGTYAAGLMYLDKKSNSFISALNSNTLALPEGDVKKVRRISSAADGTLLFSTADGLLTMNPAFSQPEKIRIYTSHHSSGDTTALLSRDVLQTLTCKKNKRIYVTTMGGGFQTIESANLLQNGLKFRQITDIPAGMGNIQSMVEDHNGKVWLVGENSIVSLNSDGSIGQVYSTNKFGLDVEFSEAKPCFNPASRSIVLGVMGGVIIFRPDDIRETKFKPSLVFCGIQYQGDEGITPLVGNNEIELPVDRHNAVVYFSALDYSDNSQIRYAYRIRELEQGWSYVGSEHCAPLSNMPPGHYTLEVRSTNSDGIWMENNAELKIYVVPTFWQTPWAWIIYLLLAGLLVYGIVYLFQLRNAHRIEKEINERQLRFFTDISHQLRTPLTLIGGPVSAVLNTENLSEKAATYLRYVESNANKMLQIVNKSLSLSKLQKLNQEMQYPEDSTPDTPNPIPDSRLSTPDNRQSTIDNRHPIIDNRHPIIASRPSPLAPQTFSEDLTILIVEDNDELRYFLTTTLATHYNIIEAENGKVGLKLAAEKQPDFIITDIMMPVMDGISMIRHIKADENICHIPIIILSARTADIYRIEGLKEGADDYITKPFSVSYLQVRVESIVRQRRLLQETWRKSLQTQTAKNAPEEEQTQTAELSPNDKRFTDALTAYLNDSLMNENLKIDDIAQALGVSRSVLYGKIKSIYGLSPNDVLRNMRMDKACQMLRQDFNKTVAEIAYAVGFSEPKYFARSFKQCIGKTPTEYRKEV